MTMDLPVVALKMIYLEVIRRTLLLPTFFKIKSCIVKSGYF